MPSISADEKKWRVESDLETIQRAEEIRKDPKRMEEVRKLARKKAAGLKKITGNKA